MLSSRLDQHPDKHSALNRFLLHFVMCPMSPCKLRIHHKPELEEDHEVARVGRSIDRDPTNSRPTILPDLIFSGFRLPRNWRTAGLLYFLSLRAARSETSFRQATPHETSTNKAPTPAGKETPNPAGPPMPVFNLAALLLCLG